MCILQRLKQKFTYFINIKKNDFKFYKINIKKLFIAVKIKTCYFY